MKSTFKTALLSVSALSLSAGFAFADFELNILHINDLHSRIEAINKFDSTCSAEELAKEECFGGFARVKAAIDTRKAALGPNANTLVLDAGDQFQGSLFYTQYKSATVSELMNKTGFDAMAVGNHEFDDGPAELLKFIEAAQFPIISGNTMAGDSSELSGKIKPYIIKSFGDQKVAVLSVLATDTDETSSPGNKILFADEISYLNQAVAEVKEQGVNKIVLLSHVGYYRDRQIAAAVDGIDVIVGGHSHTLLSSTDEKAAGPYPSNVKGPSGVDVPIVTAYAYSKYLGELKVVFDDAGVVKSATGAPLLLDATVKPDAEIAARVTELAAPLEEIKRKEVGSATADIDGARETCRTQECSMGNLVADAVLDRVKGQGITISIQGGGGLRASIKSGTITMGDVLTVLPFQNSIATFKLRGSDIREALENGASKIEETAGRFAQVAGLRYTFDPSLPAGKRIIDIDVKEGDAFVPIDPNKVYGVVTNNYMRAGGDGYDVFANKAEDAYDFGPSLEEAVAAYLTANSPYTPVIDGRIKLAASAGTAPDAPATTTAEPAASAVAPAGQSAATTSDYTIQRGDSLWKIATEKLGDGHRWTSIAKENNLKQPNLILPGNELTIPAQ
jgi:5'-nucleotidase/UDP-sugar diphosphatase